MARNICSSALQHMKRDERATKWKASSERPSAAPGQMSTCTHLCSLAAQETRQTTRRPQSPSISVMCKQHCG
ncbi:hypothetical protein JOB18_038753, partial [Solea senegalensis]